MQATGKDYNFFSSTLDVWKCNTCHLNVFPVLFVFPEQEVVQSNGSWECFPRGTSDKELMLKHPLGCWDSARRPSAEQPWKERCSLSVLPTGFYLLYCWFYFVYKVMARTCFLRGLTNPGSALIRPSVPWTCTFTAGSGFLQTPGGTSQTPPSGEQMLCRHCWLLRSCHLWPGCVSGSLQEGHIIRYGEQVW